MKQRYNSRNSKKNTQVRKTMPFEGLIKQLRKESLVLVNLEKARPFAEACFAQGIKIGVGSVYNGGVVIYEDK